MVCHLERLTLALFFSVVVALSLFLLKNPDFGFHLKAGEYIWSTWSIPDRDVFSYLAAGNRWVDSHWLFQLVLYGVYSVAGIPGIILLRISVLVAAFALLLATVYRREYFAISVFVGLLALSNTFHRFVIRPELLSFLFLAAFFFLLERFSRHPRLSLIAIPLLQVIWTNAHGLHILGVAFVGLYVLGDALQVLAHRLVSAVPDPGIAPRELRLKGYLVVLTCAALLPNANGIDGILYPLAIFRELRSEVSWFPAISELVPPFLVYQPGMIEIVTFYKAFLVISALTWLGSIRRLRFAHALLYAAFLYVSLLAYRNIALFAIVATPITVRNLHEALDHARGAVRFRLPTRMQAAAVTSLVMLFVAAGVWTVTVDGRFYKWMHWKRSFGVGVSKRYPAGVVEHLKSIDGNIFNGADIGGYLIWKLYPEKQVALDGRWEVYGESLSWLSGAYSDPAVFSLLVERHDIAAVVLSRGSLWARRMGPWIRRSPGWKRTLVTPNAVVFERTDRFRRRSGPRGPSG